MLNRADKTPRYSLALDLFHDLEDSVAQSAETDAAALRATGHDFSWLLRAPAFHRAVVRIDTRSLNIEWAQDSPFRFYPVHEDDRFGYRLHDAEAVINKVLALAVRSEIRDFVDVLHLDEMYLSLGALAWAACGKDPGFTPEFLLEHAARHAAYTQRDLDRLSLREPLDLGILKQRRLAALARARTLVAALPPDEVGCLYLDSDQRPAAADAAAVEVDDRGGRQRVQLGGDARRWSSASARRDPGENAGLRIRHHLGMSFPETVRRHLRALGALYVTARQGAPGPRPTATPNRPRRSSSRDARVPLRQAVRRHRCQRWCAYIRCYRNSRDASAWDLQRRLRCQTTGGRGMFTPRIRQTACSGGATGDKHAGHFAPEITKIAIFRYNCHTEPSTGNR